MMRYCIDMVTVDVRQQRLLEIKRIVEEYSLLRGEFTLFSGQISNYYIDGKMSTFRPDGAFLIAKEILERLSDVSIDAIGGRAIGATPIATAVSIVGYLEGKFIPAFALRPEKKEHGTQKLIEGNLPSPGGKVVIVDDVVTKGGSIKEVIEAVEARGCQVVKIIVLLDRRSGGSDELRKRGYDFSSILSTNEAGVITIDQP